MKIAITASGASLEAAFNPRFGRAENFVLYDTETHEVSELSNTQNLNAAQGAGIQAAQNVAEAGVQAVVSGHFGPKAFRALEAAGVQMFTCEAKTVDDALMDFKRERLSSSDAPDVEGHWE